jgi:hypothetical protein
MDDGADAPGWPLGSPNDLARFAERIPSIDHGHRGMRDLRAQSRHSGVPCPLWMDSSRRPHSPTSSPVVTRNVAKARQSFSSSSFGHDLPKARSRLTIGDAGLYKGGCEDRLGLHRCGWRNEASRPVPSAILLQSKPFCGRIKFDGI